MQVCKKCGMEEPKHVTLGGGHYIETVKALVGPTFEKCEGPVWPPGHRDTPQEDKK